MLTSKRVTAIFMDCLYKDGEDSSNHIKCEGIISNFGFNPERVKRHKHRIELLLNELHDNFKEGKGGGWSFLNMCNDKKGRQWTGLHKIMEQLVVLGIAIGKIEYVMPRAMWSIFPGSVPYIMIKKED